MKLQQLRYLVAVVDNGMNITAASESLFTSQPGVSKQIRLLEDELSLQIFRRRGKSLQGLTEAGQEVLERARRILTEAENIKSLSRDLSGQMGGELRVATTHTQARYVMPDLLEQFQKKHEQISIRLHQGTSDHIAGQVSGQQADFAIASGHSNLFSDLVTFPMYEWERAIVVRPDHPLANSAKVSLADLARYPLISYTHSFDHDSDQAQAFRNAGIEPNVVFTAEDPDVIKTCVRKGMGVGLVACMALETEADAGLVSLNASHLFPTCTTWIGFRRDLFLRDYMLSFVEMMVPRHDRHDIQRAINGEHPLELATVVSAVNDHSLLPPCCRGGFNL